MRSGSFLVTVTIQQKLIGKLCVIALGMYEEHLQGACY
eukprot:CCRYP_018433-RA/>CCRYP_018433-RA protein AED:0.21 eAED:1.00 QI:0/-1/0/1/-1/0/1/0/37